MKHVRLDADGRPLGFWSDEVHGERVPSDAVPITEEQFREFRENKGRRALRDGQLVEVELPSPPREAVIDFEYQTRLQAGAPWNDLRISTDPENREYLSAQVQRFNANGNLRKDAPSVHVSSPDGSKVEIPKDSLVEAATAVFDYIDELREHRDTLLADETLDPTDGWPE